jgi:hypothetical protein
MYTVLTRSVTYSIPKKSRCLCPPGDSVHIFIEAPATATPRVIKQHIDMNTIPRVTCTLHLRLYLPAEFERPNSLDHDG